MKLILLDRDGVINVDRPHSVKSRDELVLLPRAAAAIKILNEASFPLAVVTNQACVGRGELSEEGLEDIHSYLQHLLQQEGAFVDCIFSCTSADNAHPCRKPNPGLLLDALHKFNVKPQEAIIIGDDIRDLEAGKAAGCHRSLVCTGKGERVLQGGSLEGVLPVMVFKDLFDAASHLIQFGL